MHRAAHHPDASVPRPAGVTAALWGALALALVAVGAGVEASLDAGALVLVPLAPGVVAVALLASALGARGWSRGRERRREQARALAPRLTWAHPDVTEAAISDPGRRDRMG